MNKCLAVLAFVFLMCGQANAQFSTTFAKNASPGQQAGFYYSLPQTVLQLDFLIEESELVEGPFSNYASRYLGSADMVEFDGKEYKIVDVTMHCNADPDPNATFFVALGSGRGSAKVDFDILPNGIIRSVSLGNAVDDGYQPAPAPTVEKPGAPEPKRASSQFINMAASGKSTDQLAKEAADKIEEIRKAKFNLLSGFYEVAYDKETLDDMFQRLDEMEAEYVSLFSGKRITKQVVKSVYVIPVKDIPTMTVAKFSESEGLTIGTSGIGSPITVQALPLNNLGTVNAPSQSAIESMTYESKVIYRVPDMANVKVMMGRNVLLEKRVGVNQLGQMLMAPVTNTRLIFNTETGQITNLRMY